MKRLRPVPLSSLEVGGCFVTVFTERFGEVLGMHQDGSYFVALGPSENAGLGHEQKNVHAELKVWQADKEYRTAC